MPKSENKRRIVLDSTVRFSVSYVQVDFNLSLLFACDGFVLLSSKYCLLCRSFLARFSLFSFHFWIVCLHMKAPLMNCSLFIPAVEKMSCLKYLIGRYFFRKSPGHNTTSLKLIFRLLAFYYSKLLFARLLRHRM